MGIAISDEERKAFSVWTELDEDLKECNPIVAQTVLESRLAGSRGDYPRSKYWNIPEDVDVFADIPYIDDGLRAHKLDLYLPHDSVVRGGKTTPVYVDIHGGGFMYGYKELNRNFCINLVEQGFAVFSLSYRLCPETDVLGQLDDISRGFAWIHDHMDEYPVDSSSVFITGDSAGGTLGLYSVAMEASAKVAEDFEVQRAGLHIIGASLVSGLFNLQPYIDSISGKKSESGYTDKEMEVIGPLLFGRFLKKCPQWADTDRLVDEVNLPPIFLNTSSDDFIEADTLFLASILSGHQQDFELHDRYVHKGETLGHVYPVCMSWLDESQETFRQIREFSYNHL